MGTKTSDTTDAMRPKSGYIRVILVLALGVAGCGPAPGYRSDGTFYGYGPAPYPGQQPPPADCRDPECGDPNAYGPVEGGYTSQDEYGPSQEPYDPSAGGAAAPMDPNAGYGQQGGPAGQPPYPFGTNQAPPPAFRCDDSCRFAGNGECDDGRAGSDTDLCAFGTDCRDCGA